MEIWIILDGEKVGPLHDFEIRSRIESGQLETTTPAWHEGQGAWKPLGEIDLFKREFDRIEPAKETPPPQPAAGPATPPQIPPLPQATHFARRFWARWFDLSLYSALWWFGMWLVGQDIGAIMNNTWIMFFQYVPWFVFETLMIHYRTTTPGKWLLGLRVTNADQSPLDLAAATRRSGRVLFTGIGFGWNLLCIFCQALSWFTAKRLGATLWDHVGGHRVNVEPLSAGRIVTLVIGFIIAVQLQTLVVVPTIMRTLGEQRPDWKPYLEANPPWQLPERSRNP